MSDMEKAIIHLAKNRKESNSKAHNDSTYFCTFLSNFFVLPAEKEKQSRQLSLEQKIIKPKINTYVARMP